VSQREAATYVRWLSWQGRTHRGACRQEGTTEACHGGRLQYGAVTGVGPWVALADGRSVCVHVCVSYYASVYACMCLCVALCVCVCGQAQLGLAEAMLPLARMGHVTVTEWVHLTMAALFRRLQGNQDDGPEAQKDGEEDAEGGGPPQPEHPSDGDDDEDDEDEKKKNHKATQVVAAAPVPPAELAAQLRARGLVPWPADAYERFLPVRTHTE
jgi:hypothetical protein